MADCECTVCFHSFDSEHHIPRILKSCGHTLCQECITGLSQARASRAVACPVCRVESKWKDSLDSFPKNFALLETIEKRQFSSSFLATSPSSSHFLSTSPGSPVFLSALQNHHRATLESSPGGGHRAGGVGDEEDSRCENCGAQAEFGCADCATTYCSPCWVAVHRIGVLKIHQKVRCSDIFDVQCGQHPGRRKELVCVQEQCAGFESTVCFLCLRQHPHKDHRAEPLEDVAARKRRQLQIAIEQLQQQASSTSRLILSIQEADCKLRGSRSSSSPNLSSSSSSSSSSSIILPSSSSSSSASSPSSSSSSSSSISLPSSSPLSSSSSSASSSSSPSISSSSRLRTPNQQRLRASKEGSSLERAEDLIQATFASIADQLNNRQQELLALVRRYAESHGDNLDKQARDLQDLLTQSATTIDTASQLASCSDAKLMSTYQAQLAALTTLASSLAAIPTPSLTPHIQVTFQVDSLLAAIKDLGTIVGDSQHFPSSSSTSASTTTSSSSSSSSTVLSSSGSSSSPSSSSSSSSPSSSSHLSSFSGSPSQSQSPSQSPSHYSSSQKPAMSPYFFSNESNSAGASSSGSFEASQASAFIPFCDNPFASKQKTKPEPASVYSSRSSPYSYAAPSQPEHIYPASHASPTPSTAYSFKPAPENPFESAFQTAARSRRPPPARSPQPDPDDVRPECHTQ